MFFVVVILCCCELAKWALRHYPKYKGCGALHVILDKTILSFLAMEYLTLETTMWLELPLLSSFHETRFRTNIGKTNGQANRLGKSADRNRLNYCTWSKLKRFFFPTGCFLSKFCICQSLSFAYTGNLHARASLNLNRFALICLETWCISCRKRSDLMATLHLFSQFSVTV